MQKHRSPIPGNIRRYRRFRGMTQKALASRLAIDPATLSKYEHGQTKVPAEVLVTIAHILRVPLTTLTEPAEADALPVTTAAE